MQQPDQRAAPPEDDLLVPAAGADDEHEPAALPHALRELLEEPARPSSAARSALPGGRLLQRLLAHPARMAAALAAAVIVAALTAGGDRGPAQPAVEPEQAQELRRGRPARMPKRGIRRPRKSDSPLSRARRQPHSPAAPGARRIGAAATPSPPPAPHVPPAPPLRRGSHFTSEFTP